MEKQGFTADKTSFSLFTTQRYDTPMVICTLLHPVRQTQRKMRNLAQ